MCLLLLGGETLSGQSGYSASSEDSDFSRGKHREINAQRAKVYKHKIPQPNESCPRSSSDSSLNNSYQQPAKQLISKEVEPLNHPNFAVINFVMTTSGKEDGGIETAVSS